MLYTPEQLLLFYKAQIQPSLHYCSHVWGCAPKHSQLSSTSVFTTTLQNLQTVQNILLKIIIHKNKLFSTKLLYKDAKVFKIKHIYIYQYLLKVHYTQSKYSQLTTQTRPVAEFNLETNVFKRSLTQRSFFYYGPRYLNKLPGTLKQIK
nr:unnamed protein product [Callosobruchus analis]